MSVNNKTSLPFRATGRRTRFPSNDEEHSLPAAKPFLKWAGGKGQILHELLPRCPNDFGAYHEPFVGGGALFFRLHHTRFGGKGRPSPARGWAVLSDANAELMNCYRVLRGRMDELIHNLRKHRYDRDYFYRVRAQDPAKLSPVRRAARIIFLNKTCYNGLYRVNSKGLFNVPFGRYRNPVICDEHNLRKASRALKGVRFFQSAFEKVLMRAEQGDFIYFDPPYHPLSTTASFTSYDRLDFGKEDQARLAEVFAALDKRGCRVMLSNSDTPLIRRLYKGFFRERILAARNINSRADRRGRIAELVIRNYR